jgi:hypothetical protein
MVSPCVDELVIHVSPSIASHKDASWPFDLSTAAHPAMIDGSQPRQSYAGGRKILVR